METLLAVFLAVMLIVGAIAAIFMLALMGFGALTFPVMFMDAWTRGKTATRLLDYGFCTLICVMFGADFVFEASALHLPSMLAWWPMLPVAIGVLVYMGAHFDKSRQSLLPRVVDWMVSCWIWMEGHEIRPSSASGSFPQ